MFRLREYVPVGFLWKEMLSLGTSLKNVIMEQTF